MTGKKNKIKKKSMENKVIVSASLTADVAHPPRANSLTTVAPGFITVRQPRAHIAARSLCRVGLVMWHERAWLGCSSAAVHVSISAFLGSLHPSCKPIRLLTMLSAPPPSIFTPASSFPY